jgi:bla regulator protein BlaR1
MTSWVPFDLLDHLWQSTLFAGVVWLVALTLRANGARVRYWLWFAASMKFLIPLSLLVSVGQRFAWRTEPVAAPPVVSFVIDQVLTPAGTARSATIADTVALGAPMASPAAAISWLLLAAWAAGVSFVLLSWWRQWLPFRRARAEAHAIDVSAEHNAAGLTIMASPSMIEPGVCGIFRPVLLVPEWIGDRLTHGQLRALIAHEHCHVRHRDNLTAALHMVVEALFWFHPLVWWIERRLIDERERACDEYVLQAGSTPRDYAEGILEVCRFAVDSPLACVAGVSGSDLRRRIEIILRDSKGRPLTPRRRALLGALIVVAVGGPVTVGAVQSAAPPSTSQTAAVLSRFDVVSIKPCQEPPQLPGRVMRPGQTSSPGRLRTDCVPLLNGNGIGLIADAYTTLADGHLDFGRATTPITGGPSWLRSAFYEITATAEGNPSVEMMAGPMMQTLLEDRFHLKIHRETTEGPVYVLSVARGGPRLRAFTEESCVPDSAFPSQPLPAGREYCRLLIGARSPASVDAQGITLDAFAKTLRLVVGRPVIDKTGIAGRFDIRIEFSREGTAMAAMPLAGGPPSDPTGASSIFTVLQEQLGLKLESGKGPVDKFVIDSIERPTEN